MRSKVARGNEYNVSMKKHLRVARVFAKLLDNQFSFLGIKFGIDPILDLVPGLGDVAGMILSSYLVWIAWEIGLPTSQIGRMIKNILVDFVVGIIPVVGPVADVFYRANLMNLEILEKFDRSIVDGEIV